MTDDPEPEPGPGTVPGTRGKGDRRPPATPEQPRRLSLADPLPGRAAEDRPESWGDRDDTDADRLGHYLANRPPHHGG